MWNGTKNQVTVYLIRHGKTLANETRRYLGKTDEDLTEQGRKEISERAARNYYPHAQQVYTSSMQRCKTTADLIYPELSQTVISEWDEIDFGSFEGKTYQELSDVPDYQEWIDSGGMLAFPGGESREAFIERCARGMERMVLLLSEEVGTASLVVHGGTIMALLNRYSGGDYFDYQTENGTGFRAILEREQKGLKLNITLKEISKL